MDYETIILEKKEHIAKLILNRPERLNALTPQMIQEVISVFDDLEEDLEMRVLVVTGAGRGFCAGADIGGRFEGQREEAEVKEGAAEEARLRMSRNQTVLIRKLRGMRIPSIAMVNGVCVGAGAEIAFACDMRTGSENARFMNAFHRIGLVPGWGGCWSYPKVMPLGIAFEKLLTGDFMEAAEAERWGVLNHLVPAAELEEKTMELARKLADGPPIAIRLVKEQVWGAMNMDWELAIRMAVAYEGLAITSADHKEGVTAFREKRRAKFQGR